MKKLEKSQEMYIILIFLFMGWALIEQVKGQCKWLRPICLYTLLHRVLEIRMDAPESTTCLTLTTHHVH
jgi:hypothetical protein